MTFQLDELASLTIDGRKWTLNSPEPTQSRPFDGAGLLSMGALFFFSPSAGITQRLQLAAAALGPCHALKRLSDDGTAEGEELRVMTLSDGLCS